MPEFQRQGTGSELIKEGIKTCQRLGFDSVIVLGHPEYYPRFWFKPANTWGIRDPFSAPAEAFMVLEFKKGALEGTGGVVKYLGEFLKA